MRTTYLVTAEARRHAHGRRCWWNHLEARWSCASLVHGTDGMPPTAV